MPRGIEQWNTAELAQLPTKGGFRLRGIEMTRTETFTDAAFAFAVTLLVVSIDQIPTTMDELYAALRGIPAFLMSFGLLMLFWSGHWAWSRRFGLEDPPSILLSLALVFVVLCYVYPLKFLSSLFMLWISGGALATSATIHQGSHLYSIFIIYGIGFVLLSFIVVLLNVHALRRQQSLALNRLELFLTRCEIGAWAIIGGVGLLSVLLAALTPPTQYGIPGFVYMSLAVIMPVYGILTGKRAKSLQPSGAATR